MDQPRYFNIESESRYHLDIIPCLKMEDLDDSFVTEEDLKLRFGPNVYIPTYATRLSDTKLIRADIARYAEELERTGAKSITIVEPELLELLSGGRVNELHPGLMRRGNKLMRHTSRTRTKKRPSKSDVNDAWYMFGYCFAKEYRGAWLPHIPIRLRTVELFELYKKAFGWRAYSACIRDPKQRRWIRMIWLNPKEYI